MKLTININPKDVIAVTHADDGRAVLSFGLVTDGGCNVEIALTVEEKADDVIRAMGFEDAVASDFAEFDKLKNPDFEMGGRIKQRLEELGMSQRELAKACTKNIEKQKKPDEIMIGDEVQHGYSTGIVYVVGELILSGLCTGDESFAPFQWYKEECKKTGRRFETSFRQINEEETQ